MKAGAASRAPAATAPRPVCTGGGGNESRSTIYYSTNNGPIYCEQQVSLSGKPRRKEAGLNPRWASGFRSFSKGRSTGRVVAMNPRRIAPLGK
jgi:hypothetical protein